MASGYYIKKGLTVAEWEEKSVGFRTIPKGVDVDVLDEDDNVIYTVTGNGVDDIFDLPQKFTGVTGGSEPIVQNSLPVGGIVFNQTKQVFKINQVADIVISEASSGHTADTWMEAVVIINGNDTNTIATDISNIDLAGDALDASKTNSVVFGYLNKIVNFSNQISNLDIVDVTNPILSGVAVDTIADTTSTIKATSNEAGSIKYALFTDSAVRDASTYADVVAGTGADKFGSMTAVASVQSSASITGLVASTAYYYKVFAVDGASLVSTEATGTFSTIAEAGLTPLYENLVQVTYDGTATPIINMGGASALINLTNFEVLHRISATDGQPTSNKAFLGARSQVASKIGGFWYLLDTAGKIQLKYANSANTVQTFASVDPVNADGAIGQKTINIRKTGATFSLYVDSVLVPLDVDTVSGTSEIADINMYSGALNNDGTFNAPYEGTQKALVWYGDILSPSQRASKIAEIELL